MKTKIAIVDYGLGNLHSVKNAFDFIGCEAFISADPKELDRAEGLILPGVGAFPDAMKCLTETKLDKYVIDSSEKRPLLGICLGMQLLFKRGFEFQECSGLGLIDGDVVKIEHPDVKVPHIGWNELKIVNNSELLKNIGDNPQVYFVHSYKAVVENRENLLAITDHGGEITAVVGRETIFGCQFHPEKSGETGLQILKNFEEICR